MGMYLRFEVEGPVNLPWPPKVAEFNVEDYSFRLCRAYRILIFRVTGMGITDETVLEKEEVKDLARALDAVALDRLRTEAAVFAGADPILNIAARKGISPRWRALVESRLARRRHMSAIEALNDRDIYQLARMFRIFAGVGARLLGY